MEESLRLFFTIAGGTLVSEDLASIAAGTLAGRGEVSLLFAIAACFSGIFFGDVLLYLAGRIFGRRAVSIPPLSWIISERSLDRAASWIGKHGMSAVFLSRLTPGLRLPVYFASGLLKTNGLQFTAYFAAAAAVWTPVIVSASALLGASFGGIETLNGSVWFGSVAAVILIFICLNILLRLMTWRGRRSLVGFWRRWTNWEFWPLQIFYLPVAVYICYLSVRSRSITAFADANPAIVGGGTVGERKSDIYRGLRSAPAALPHLLGFALIPAGLATEERLSIAEQYVENGVNYPVAVKPDRGERGAGVRIIHDRKGLADHLERCDGDLLIQEYASGPELSVFYYRYPNKDTGKIFSITEKRLPSVTGDGSSSLEKLILNDPRAVAIASAYLEHNSASLDRVPAAGEEVQIVDIGTHSKGAVFLDGSHLLSDELEAAIDRVCRGYSGFCFGRFDLKAESAGHLKNGEFKIVELNGVTSESTNIYDPNFTLLDAYRTLFRQWAIAFEIGLQNREAGNGRTSLRSLFGLIAERYLGTQTVPYPVTDRTVSDLD